MNRIVILASFLLFSLSLVAQFDQEGIIEKETSLTKEVEVKDEDGILTVKILSTDGEGNEEVTIWTGTADAEDMPEEVRVIVEEGLQDNKSAATDNKQIRLKVLNEDGEEKLLEWDGNGEMPAEMKQLLDENDYNIDRDSNPNNTVQRRQTQKRMPRKIEYDPSAVPEFNGRGYGHKYGGKAKIGVKISEESGRVAVVETMPNTAASAAGVLKDDSILKLDDTDIDNLDRLYAELATHNPGDKVKMVVRRNGKEKTLTLILK